MPEVYNIYVSDIRKSKILITASSRLVVQKPCNRPMTDLSDERFNKQKRNEINLILNEKITLT